MAELSILKPPGASTPTATLRVLHGAEELTVPQDSFVRRSQLIVDPNMSVRQEPLDDERVNRYKELYLAQADIPKPLVYMVDDVLYLVDGFHRCAALDIIAQNNREPDYSLLVRVVVGTYQEAELAAADANLAHGKHMTKQDMREAIRRYLRNTDLSYAEIGRRLGVAHTTPLRVDRKENIRPNASIVAISIDPEDIAKGTVALPPKPTTVMATRKGATYAVDITGLRQRERTPRKGYDPKEPNFWRRRGWLFDLRPDGVRAVNSENKLATAMCGDIDIAIEALIDNRVSSRFYQDHMDGKPSAIREEDGKLTNYTPTVVIDDTRWKLVKWSKKLPNTIQELTECAILCDYDATVLLQELASLHEAVEAASRKPSDI